VNVVLFAAFPHTDSESDLSTLDRSQSPLTYRRHLSPHHRLVSPHRAASPISPSSTLPTPERKARSLPRNVINRVNGEWEGGLSNTSKLFNQSNSMITTDNPQEIYLGRLSKPLIYFQPNSHLLTVLHGLSYLFKPLNHWVDLVQKELGIMWETETHWTCPTIWTQAF